METESYLSLPASVKEARLNKSKNYFTGQPCKRGHIAPRFTSTRKCYECSKGYCKEQYQNTPAMRGRSKKWYWNNYERSLATLKAYRENNPGVIAASAKARRQATPAWVNKKELNTLYKEAKQLTNATGVPHEVDHIIPISNAKVCGLHVKCNLRIITRELNRAKRNKFECRMTT